MDRTRGRERIDTIVIGAGQAGLSAGYHLAKRGRAVRDPRRRRADRRPLAAPLGLAAAVQPGALRRAARDALSRAGVRTTRPAARWATTSRRTPRGSTCPSGAGRASTRVRPATGGRRLRRDGRRAAVRGRAQVIVATGAVQPAARPRLRRSSSTRRSASCTRASTGTRRSCATAPCSSSASATRARTSRSRRPERTGRCSPVMPTASSRSRSSTRGGRGSVAGDRVRGQARADDAHADRPEDGADIVRKGGGPLLRIRQRRPGRGRRGAPRREGRRRHRRQAGAGRRDRPRRRERRSGPPASGPTTAGSSPGRRRRRRLADGRPRRRGPSTPGLYFLGVPFPYAFTSMLVAVPAATRGTSSSRSPSGCTLATALRAAEAPGAAAR